MSKLRLRLWFWSRRCSIIITIVFNICCRHFSQNLYFLGVSRSRFSNWWCRYQWWSFELFFGIYQSKNLFDQNFPIFVISSDFRLKFLAQMIFTTFDAMMCLILTQTYMLWSFERWFSWFWDVGVVADWINGLK